jgi:hypothetical protein
MNIRLKNSYAYRHLKGILLEDNKIDIKEVGCNEWGPDVGSLNTAINVPIKVIYQL